VEPPAWERTVSRLLFIVSRGAPARYTYLQHVYGNEAVEVIMDRRVGQRRRSQRPAAVERRRKPRRQRDLTGELKQFGWALVRQ